MSTPRVTVGMPVYNRSGVIASTIRYVLNQTFNDFELLVFDDGSVDGSPETIRSLSDNRIVFLGSRRCGPPRPLNAIYTTARGEFLIILHDNDIFDPTLLEKCVDVLDRNPNAAFALQGIATVAEDGVSNYQEMLQGWPELNAGRQAGSKMLRTSHAFASPFHASSMVRASALDQVGRYYELRYGLHADIDLWLRLLRRFDFCYIDEVLLKCREREKVGHILTGREAEVLQTLRLIFIKNALDYFADDPQGLNEALENVRVAYTENEFRAAIRELLGRGQNSMAGVQRVAANPMHRLLRRKLAGLLGRMG